MARFNTRDNFFFEWKEVGPVEGQPTKRIDMAHITPFQFRRFFPQMFEGVRDYYKFGFVRNPYERYLSAISQHLKLGSPHMREAILKEPHLFYDVASSFARHCLVMGSVERDLRMVHFRPQSHFHFIDGHQWVDEIFKLEELQALVGRRPESWLGDATQQQRNKTEEFPDGYDLTRLDPRAVEVITAFYARDFERFGYDPI